MDTLRRLIAEACQRQREAIRPLILAGRGQTYSRPLFAYCEDGNYYVVKALQHGREHEMGRTLVADHVAGLLGKLLQCPVPEIKLIRIEQDLLGLPEFSDVLPGIAHGSLFHAGYSDRIDEVGCVDQGDNRQRFAKLAVLYALFATLPNDRQFIYRITPPHLVMSVDHGHILPEADSWSMDSLKRAPIDDAEPDPIIVTGCGLTPDELRSAADRLQLLTEEVIAEVVARPPDEWGIIFDERVALAEYLIRRRDALLRRLDGGR